MRRRGSLFALVAALAALLWLFGSWSLPGPLLRDQEFNVPQGASLSSVATQLQEAGAVRSAALFKLRARLLGGSAPIKAGHFVLPKGASESSILDLLQGGKVLRRFVTIPEGMPSILVYERLMATPGLAGEIPIPAEGSILPDTYEVGMGESRAAVVARMQAAMNKTLAELWAERSATTVVKTPQEAIILAGIVEKETAKAEERRLIAGLYTNRLRIGMRLQADPTVIYPITKGKALGRRILKSELRAKNGYNTYTKAGLPIGPITNPGRASIEAVLNPASTKDLYIVADGQGGHVFADTLAEHNANVARWYAIRRARGEM